MSRKAEFLSTIKPILDKKEAKRDAIELAKELSDVLGGIDIDADGSSFNELKEIFNAQLVEMGKQPIVFSESTLKGITVQFANAVSAGIKVGVAEGGNAIKSMLKDKAALEEAYDRRKNGRGSKAKVEKAFGKHASEATSYQPATTTKAASQHLRSFKNQYENATDWENKYIALLKYIKEYEALESLTKKPEVIDKWKTIGDYSIDELKRQIPEIQHSLQNIFNLAHSIPPVGLTPDGVVDANVHLNLLNTIDTYDVTGGKGEIEVPVKPEIEEYKAYRAIEYNSKKLKTKTEAIDDWGAEYWATDKSAAQSYTGNHYGESSILIGTIKPTNPLIIDVEELQWDAFDEIPEIKELFPGISDVMKQKGYYSDLGQKYINEQARLAGFDAVIFKNVQDNFDADLNGDAPISDTIAVLDDRIISLNGAFAELEGQVDESGNKLFSKSKDVVPDFYEQPIELTPEQHLSALQKQQDDYDKWYQATISRLSVDKADADVIQMLQEQHDRAIKNFEAAIGYYQRVTGDDAMGSVKEKANTRRKELTQQLNEYGGDVLDSKTADDNLAKRKEIFELLHKEDLLTDEIKKNYDEVNQRLEARADLIREAEGYYDDINDTVSGIRVDAIDSEEQYRKDHLDPFDAIVDKMRSSGVFSEDELEKSFYEVLDVMESHAQDIGIKSAFDELDNRVVNPEDITDISELNRLLQERQNIIENAGEWYLEQYDSGAYEEAINLNDAIADRIALLQQNDEEDDDIRRENGALEEKLELLRDIAEEYGSDITQKQRDRHEELNQKDMDSGLTTKEEERFWELSEKIEDADESLVQFGETYDRIVLKLANGKKVEILPDDKGLRSLLEFADGYGDEFKGIEIEDVVFERAKQETPEVVIKKIESYEELCEVVERYNKLVMKGSDRTRDERAELEVLNERIYATKGARTPDQMINDSIIWNRITGPLGEVSEENLAHYLGIEIPKAAQAAEDAVHDLNAELDNVNAGTGSSDVNETEQLRQEINALQERLQHQADEMQDEANRHLEARGELYQQIDDAEFERDKALNAQREAEAEAERLRQELSERPAGGSTSTAIESDVKASITIEELKGVLEGITFNIKDTSEQPENDAQGPWALEQTLNTTIKNLLENIRQNTSKIGDPDAQQIDASKIAEVLSHMSPQVADVGNVLATEGTLSAIKTAVESINGKTVKGTKVGSGSTHKTTTKDDYVGSKFFGEKLKTREMELAKFVQKLMNEGQDTPKMQDAVKQLRDALKLVNSGEKLSVWDQKFRQAKLSVGIDELKEKPDEQESVQTYKNLIAYAKEYYSIVEKHEKAKENTQRKAILAQQKQDAETFMSNGGLNLDTLELGDEAYNKKLSDLRAKHKRNLEVIRADNSDKTNAQDITEKAKIRADALATEEKEVNKLADAYKILGKLIAERNYATLPEEKDAIQAIINKHVKDINANQYNTANRFDMLRGIARTSQTQAEEGLSRKAAKKTGSDRLRAEAKAENEDLAKQKQIISNLISLYKQLGQAKARQNKGLFSEEQVAQAYAEDAQLRRLIKTERAKLSSVDLDTDMRFKGAKAEGYRIATTNAERAAAGKATSQRMREETKAENEALREQKQVIKELIDLYKQLGQAEAKRDMTSSDIGMAVTADAEAEEIREEIKAKRQLINVNDELENQFADSWMAGIEKETQKPIKDLKKEYEKLGELRALIDKTPDGEYLNFLKKQLAAQEKLVDVTSRRLELNADLQFSYEQAADAAYNTKIQDIEKQAAKERDKNRVKAQEELFKKQIQQSKELAKINKAKSAIDKGDNLTASVTSISGWSDEHIAVLTKYSAELTKLKTQYNEIKYSDGIITEEQQQEIIEQTAGVNKLTQEISELIAEYNRLSGENVTELGANTLGDNATIDEKKQKLTELAMAYSNGKASVKKYDAATGELTAEISTGKYEVTEYTFAFRQLDNQLVAVQGATKKLETPMEKLRRKMSEILTYFGGSSLIYEFFGQFRQGVQYVREIDLALTELKKVTDETEETYDRFLDTAAKTADKVGSTITNIVNSTADWARLGFNMEEAAQLAESTSVLLNVSEFSSIEDATGALTSTMQAFGYVAEDSMHVVDVLNEVGKLVARR